MEITIYSSIVWFAAIMIGSLDLVIFLGSNRHSSRAFAHSILWVTIWISVMGPFISSATPETGVFFSRMTYYLGSVIAATFFYFFLSYPDDIKQKHAIAWSLFAIEVFFAYIFLCTNLIIDSVYPNNAPQPWSWNYGPLSFLFELFFFGYFGCGVYILYKKFVDTTNKITRTNLKYMLWVIIVGATPPSLFCIVFPRLGYFDLNWLGPVTELIWIPILSYSIIKYRQMNVRAVITEVLAIGMTVIFFINIFVKTPFRGWDNVITFFAFLVLAAYLIKGVLREAKQTEMLRDLNDNLALKVAEQTVEIRKAFEQEKKARRELEKLNETKNQFIMITQHHLRAPVTNIRYEFDRLVTEDGLKLDTRAKKSVGYINNSLTRLVKIVDDFLAISTLKVGSKILNLSKTSLLPVVEGVLRELDIDIHGKKLRISYSGDADKWPDLNIDISKMHEAMLIVIENAIRYNIESGEITITTATDHNHFVMKISDTGVGINKADQEKIMGHLFYRSSEAKELNPVGMGIGLSVAKAVIVAHHGELTIESEGSGKGTTITFKIPLNNENME